MQAIHNEQPVEETPVEEAPAETPMESAGEGTEQEPQPIGKGFFGNIYDQFKGKVKEAFDFLISHREGDLLGVFHRDELGDIDLIWGSNERKEGLEHIIEKHINDLQDFSSVEEAMNVIDDVIKNGTVSRENPDKVNLDYNGYRVSIKKQIRDDDGNVIGKKNWVVTAFDKKRSVKEKERASSGGTLTTPPTNQSAGGVTLPPNEARSDGKGTQNSETESEKQEKKSETAETEGQPNEDSDIDALIEDYKKKAAETNKIWRAWLADPSGKPADYGTTRDEEAKAYGRVMEALAGVSEEKLAEMENTNYGDSLLNDLIKEERNLRNEQNEIEQRFVDGLAKQGEIGKPTKPVSIEKILPEFTSRDEQRPIINCIYYDTEGYAVASDGCFKEQRYKINASNSQPSRAKQSEMDGCFKEQTLCVLNLSKKRIKSVFPGIGDAELLADGGAGAVVDVVVHGHDG